MTQHHSLRRSGTAALVLGAALLAAPPAEAQRWGRPSTPRSGACFYRNANFRGDYFCVPAGEALEQMPAGMNDKISSIRTFGDVEVLVFRNPGFSGRANRFDGDVANLQLEGWNDTLSSLEVRRSGYGRYGRNDDRGNGGFGRSGGFGGFGGARDGRDVDRIITRAYQDLLDRDPDQAGFREYRRRMIDDGWTEDQVREAIRRSPEYREHAGGIRSRGEHNAPSRDDYDRAREERSRMSRERAEDIVRRAYLSTLGREPDAAGAEGFIARVLRDNWSEQDVARELRKSPEYRNRRPPPQR